MRAFTDDQAKWDAVQRRDRDADGQFLYSVLTTGVYCRPSCASRPKRRENVAFYPTLEAAERAGYRPCKRCRPDLEPRESREAAIVATACRTIEATEGTPRLDALAAEAGVSPHHFHRMFKRIVGVTPGAYAAQCRQDRAQTALGTRVTVTEAAYDAGFNSSGRFYESAGAMLGMTPTAWKKGGSGETMWHAIGRSNLGAVLVAATAKGICSIMIHDDARRLVSELKSRFPKANHIAPAPEFSKSVEAVVRLVDDPRRSLVLPLDIRGTAFQRRVWEELRKVPAGATVTYAELAQRIGNERAVRAVGTACGANNLAVAIPCHRALGTDGKLRGYRWGLERKKKLLDRERS